MEWNQIYEHNKYNQIFILQYTLPAQVDVNLVYSMVYIMLYGLSMQV